MNHRRFEALGTAVGASRTRRSVLGPALAAATLAAMAGVTGCAGPTSTPLPTGTPTTRPTTTPTASTTPTATPTPFPRDAIVAVSSLNVRAGPNALHPQVGVALTATPLAILGRTHDGTWYAVRFPDLTEGWLDAGFVALKRDPRTIPTRVTPSPPPTPTPTATPTPTPAPMDPALPLIVAPPVLAQGDPLLVRIRAPGAAQAVAVFDGREARLQTAGADTFAGVLSASAEMPPGRHDVHVTVVDGSGNPAAHTVPVDVRPAGFNVDPDPIRIGGDMLALLDPGVSASENARLDALRPAGVSERLWHGPWQRPVTGTVSSPFGHFRNYNDGALFGRHVGLDLRGGRGTPVSAPARGRVALAEPMTIRGNVVWLDHGWGVFSGYFHLQDMAVSVGQLVEPGQLLGTVGATGRVTAPHLHWEVRVHGAAANPVQWLLRDVGAVP